MLYLCLFFAELQFIATNTSEYSEKSCIYKSTLFAYNAFLFLSYNIMLTSCAITITMSKSCICRVCFPAKPILFNVIYCSIVYRRDLLATYGMI